MNALSLSEAKRTCTAERPVSARKMVGRRQISSYGSAGSYRCKSPLLAGFSDVLGCSRKGKWWLRVPLNFAAKRLFPQSFHRLTNPGYPLFYHFFVAADPGFLRTPAATTSQGRLTGVKGSRRVAGEFVLESGKPA